ncbi:MAG TPA: hypothetical protein VFW78_06850 [Bacteroidia bacterium]|nr:hypothetical protein [Bacteroidia bacterium]
MSARDSLQVKFGMLKQDWTNFPEKEEQPAKAARLIRDHKAPGVSKIPGTGHYFFLCLFFLSLFLRLCVAILCLFLFLPLGILHVF